MSDPLLDRQVRRRLVVLRHVEEVSGNVAMSCRYLMSQSRPTCGCAATEPTGWRGCGIVVAGRRSARGRPDRVWRSPLPSAAVPLRPGEDRHVSAPVRRCDGQQVRAVADPQTAGSEPATRLPAVQAARPAWKHYEKQLPGYRAIHVKFVQPLPAAAGSWDPPSVEGFRLALAMVRDVERVSASNST